MVLRWNGTIAKMEWYNCLQKAITSEMVEATKEGVLRDT